MQYFFRHFDYVIISHPIIAKNIGNTVVVGGSLYVWSWDFYKKGCNKITKGMR